ncbi:uncharacterized protein LOC132730540 [Ruditapes philippinarum]|uniref:uncharacterized protein LOC132730540 n=1 Tax=Ruditapes philippinarum TaxID=129788 RepID=UPI00295AA426|nr:uncharacterized protein LOC132730540 [Ruditapes philippinarum]
MAYSRIDFSASFTQDSDEVQEMFCEHCDKHDKQYVPAEGFCVKCFEYLCGTCVKFHKRLLVTHYIKDKDYMPQDFCIEKCSVHQDELVKFYCQACKKFACTECKTQDHWYCSMVSHLPAFVPGIENSKASEQNITNLQDYDKLFTYQEIHESIIPRTASYHTDIKVSCCSYSSLCLLSENCLLVTYFNSRKLIIFKDMSVSTSSYDTIDLSSRCWAVAKVDNIKVAVTFVELGIIKLITFSKCMTVTKTEDIKVGEGCRGVAYSNNKLIVSYIHYLATVKILDMSGKVLKIFDKDQHGNCLFVDPYYLTISADNTVIYVSDLRKNCVIGLTFDGNVKAIYKDDQLNKPCQLTVDRSGAVFLCGLWSHNINQLSPDLTKVKILLDKKQGIKSPAGVAYCQDKNRLYVSQCGDHIKVYELSME